MAVVWRGLTERETFALTGAMAPPATRWTSAASPVRPWTSTAPAGWGTRRRWPSSPSSPRRASPSPRCPGAASATPAARWTSWSPSPASASTSTVPEILAQVRSRRGLPLRPDGDAGSRRPQTLRPARRHGHGRVPAPHRRQRHEQEARLRRPGHRAGCQSRRRRVYEDAGRRPRPRRPDDPDRAGAWAPRRRRAVRHECAPGPRRRQPTGSL